MNWRRGDRLLMKEERKKQQNKHCIKRRTEEPILAQLMGTCRSPKSALLIASAQFKALWIQNISHGEAAICSGSKWSRANTILMTEDVPNLERRGVRWHLTAPNIKYSRASETLIITRHCYCCYFNKGTASSISVHLSKGADFSRNSRSIGKCVISNYVIVSLSFSIFTHTP